MTRVTRYLLGLSLFSLALGQAQGQERVLLTPDFGQTLAEQTAPSVQESLQTLRDQAVEFGRVRVIVGLRTPFGAEGHLAAATVAEQRNEIQAMQTEVLNLLPASARSDGNVTRFDTIPFFAISVTPEELDILEDAPGVISIQEDKKSQPTLNYSVPYIGGEEAWSQGFSGAGQTVAVLDSGVDKNHPFLAGKVVSEACYSTPNTSLGEVSLCPGGVTSSTAPGSGMNCTGIAGCEHGTHVAGIVAGKGTSFSGVAKDANLIAMQVFHKVTDSESCGNQPPPCVSSNDSDIIKGLERVFGLKNTFQIAAVNMSLGGGRYFNPLLCNALNLATKAAIDNLRSVGIPTIVSSGNNGYPDSLTSPACISSAISVGSTWARSGEKWDECFNIVGTLSKPDVISCFSNSAGFLNLLAPGSKIDSSIPGGSYSMFSGTSMAAPHVAGAWAVLKQKQPTADVSTLLNAFIRSGTYILDTRNTFSKPRINIDQAVEYLSDTPAPQLYSAVLPYARATQVGKTVTAFANAMNVGAVAGENCAPSLPVGTPGTFSYQTTDASNQLTGNPDTPVNIPAGGTQNFLIALTPSLTFPVVELPILIKCTNSAAAPVFYGVNSFGLSSYASATPDLVAIGVTPSSDGVVRLPTNTGTGFFSTAAVNIGSGGLIEAVATDLGRGLPLTLQLCETKATGETIICGNNLTRTVTANETLYYTIFVTGTGKPIPFDPSVNRLFLVLGTPSGLYGATNVAVTAP